MKAIFQIAFALLSVLLVSCKGILPKGNCTYTFILQPGHGSKADISTITEKITKRLDYVGYTGEDISVLEKGGMFEISIENFDKIDEPVIRGLFLQSGNLEFWEVYENGAEIISLLQKANSELYALTGGSADAQIVNINKDTASLQGQMAQSEEREKLRKKNPLFAILQPALYQTSNGMTPMPGGVIGYAMPEDTAQIMEYLDMPGIREIFDADLVFVWGSKPAENTKAFELYALQRSGKTGGAALSGNIIADAQVDYDETRGGKPGVAMQMTKEAGFEWKVITKRNTNQSIAMVMNGKVLSAPNVQSEIAGGNSSITGNFTEQEVKTMAYSLGSALPVPFKFTDEKLSCP